MSKFIWDKKLMPQRLHPALGIADESFYFGLAIPIDDGGKIKTTLCCVNDKREHFDALDPVETAKRSFYLKNPDIIQGSELRWDLEKIRGYLDGSVQYEEGILGDIEKELRKYLELKEDDREYAFVALWIIGTYLQPVWNTYPYMSISGRKDTGKTKLLEFLEKLAFCPRLSSSISTASLYRLIQCLRPTLLVDENERYSTGERKGEIQNIVNSGYKKGAFVYRSGKTEKGQIVQEKFETFSPKAFVTYTGLTRVTEDRALDIVMRKSTRSEIADTEIAAVDVKTWTTIRNKLYVFALSKWKEIASIYRNMPTTPRIKGRRRELWKPLLTLAKFFGDKTFNKMRDFAVEKTIEHSEADAVEMVEASVLRALLEIVTKDAFYNVSTIYEKVEEIEGESSWITPTWVGKTLSRTFGFKKRRRGPGKGRPRERYIELKKIEEIAQEFGIKKDASPLPPSLPPAPILPERGPCGPVVHVVTELTVSEIAETIMSYAGSTVSKDEMAAKIGITLERLQSIVTDLSVGGKVIDKGDTVEVVRG